jgi:hypothetical protein
LGGIEDAVDDLYQQVTVPPGTTILTARGQRAVATQELGGTAYDTSVVELLSDAGLPLETALALDNTSTTAAWTSFSHTFSAPHAGESVRLRLRATNDATYPTNFFFDTLALEATVGCP